MNQILEMIKMCVELGSIYSLVVLATYLSSRTIKFQDLSVEGSFALGSAVSAVLLIMGCPAWITLPCSMVAGILVGLLTGLIHTKLHLNNLMSGIVVSSGLFSINLLLAGSNVVVAQSSTIFAVLLDYKVLVLAALSCGVIIIISWLLKTEIGVLCYGVGQNSKLLVSYGKRVDHYKILLLMIAHSLVGLAGSLLVHYTGFYSITGSIGVVIIGLIGLLLGDMIRKNSLWALWAGIIVYQALMCITIELQVNPALNKLITAGLIIVVIALRRHNKREEIYD